jgi:glycosyltransferase involved in cell wall biosynthesis
MSKRTRADHILMLGPSLEVQGGISTVERSLLEHWPVSKYRVQHLGTLVDGSKWAKLVVATKAFTRFLGLLLIRRPAVIHIHFASRASFFRKSLFVLAARGFRRRIILHAHGGEFHLFYDTESGRLGRWYIRWIVNQADRLLVVSGQWQEFYHRIYKRREPIVMHNPVHCPPLNPDRGEGAPLLLTLGRLGCGKGTYDLLAAVPRILERHPEAEFWLAGDGEVEEVRRLLRTKPYGDHVRLVGWVTGGRKEEILTRATLFVLPSYNEGLPLAVLEAMAYGLPIVSTPVGGIPEAIVDGETGFLVEPGDVEAIARKVNLLLSDAELRDRMGMNARRRAQEQFEVGAIINQLFTIYDELIAGR